MVPRAGISVVLVLLGWTSAASAQTSGRVAVGIGVGVRGNPDASASAGLGRPGIIWRVGHGREGWGFRWGLNWYSTQLQHPIGQEAATFGQLRVRPVMGGYGYQRRFGRTLVGGGVLAGYAMTSVNMKPEFADLYRRTTGASAVSVRAKNTFVVRPEMSVWIDLNDKIGLTISSAYMIARPELTVFSPGGRDTRQIKADMFSLRVGAVYSIF